VTGGGDLVLSGLMTPEADAVTVAYQSWFHMKEPRTRNEWARLNGTRRTT
jgi:ribosomal protein L11 methylase PrmA